MRVMARDHAGVDDGWLCDKGRFAYQAIHVDDRITGPLVCEGEELRQVSWQRAREAAAGFGRHPARAAVLVRGRSSTEERFLLQRLLREGLQSADIDSRVGGPVPLETAR